MLPLSAVGLGFFMQLIFLQAGGLLAGNPSLVTLCHSFPFSLYFSFHSFIDLIPCFMLFFFLCLSRHQGSMGAYS